MNHIRCLLMMLIGYKMITMDVRTLTRIFRLPSQSLKCHLLHFEGRFCRILKFRKRNIQHSKGNTFQEIEKIQYCFFMIYYIWNHADTQLTFEPQTNKPGIISIASQHLCTQILKTKEPIFVYSFFYFVIFSSKTYRVN